MIDRKTARVRRWSYALSASMSALATASAGPAWAQCSPDPAVANGTTTCTGTDVDGLRITVSDSTVQVASGTSVARDAGAAITVDIASVPDTYEARMTTIIIGGTVDGRTDSGISVLSGTVPANSYDFYGTQASVNLDAGSTITGLNAITAGSSTGNAYGPAIVSVVNAGMITGTGGIALLATDPALGGFGVIDNLQGATIGAIVGNLGELNNAGVVDGGSLSAIDLTTAYNPWVRKTGWTNSGTIRSASTAATIANLSTYSFEPLSNSGTIANTGTGAAIQGQGLDIINLAGGSITSVGGPAIAANTLTLTNEGTINGDVVIQSAIDYGSSNVIDSTLGRINGDVSLGSGNDLVYARYDGTATLVTGITGTLDAGAGINSIVLAPDTDLIIPAAIALPSGFQHLRLAPGDDATLTLAQSFVAPSTIELQGYGSVVNQAAIATQGPAFVIPYYVTGMPSLTNTGSIDAIVAPYYYAIDMGSGSLSNSGIIASSGNGVASDGDVINSGTIVAADTALSMFYGSLNNSGTIRSTAGIGISLSGSTNNTPAINSGIIEGATYGALTSYVLSNSGTIAATTNTGTAVGLQNYGILNNLTGGVIQGGAFAITGNDPYGSTSTYNAAVYNAGTINGDVTFVSPRDYAGYSNHNSFVALAGGVLNGNLTLGYGDTLVTDIVNTGSEQFAGIEGTVTTTGGLLRYRVSRDTSAVIGAVGPFATTGYELVDNARLTLTADTTQTLPLVLAGNGTVGLTADVATTNQNAVRVVGAALVRGVYQGNGQTLTIVNHGTISSTIDDYFAGAFGVVYAGASNTLQNEGTIKAIDIATNGGTSFNAAVAWTGTLVNNGRIELVSSFGSYNVDTVVNTGTIQQVDGQTGFTASYGVYNAWSVTNSGTIATVGQAIWGTYSTSVVNSGTITSTGAIAITSANQVTNLAGGTITGGSVDGGRATAVIMNGGSLVNEGSIIGDVDLGYFFGYGSAYHAHGGTITGNLRLGSGNDLFLQTGGSTGISGIIDAGEGIDIYGIALTSSGSVAVGLAPAASFEDAMVAAFGVNTVATLTGIGASFTDLHAVGDGTVVNQAALTGRVIAGADSYTAQAAIVGERLGGLINEGTIAGGVIGAVTRLANTGTITAAGTNARAIDIQNAAFTLDNAGRIASSGEGALAIRVTGSQGATLRNTGAILGAVALGDGDDLVENACTIGAISLGSGNDTFRAVGSGLAGISDLVDGGEGADSFIIDTSQNGAADQALTWAALTGFEHLQTIGTLTLAGGGFAFDTVNTVGALTIASGASLTTEQVSFGSGADMLTVAGDLTGAADLSAGNDGFRLLAGGAIDGTISGGAGIDTATLDLSGGFALTPGMLTDFEHLLTTGVGALTLADGSFAFNTMDLLGDLTAAAGASLSAGTITFGPSDNRLMIAGSFAGSVDGGAGTDTIEVSGSAAFTSVSSAEALRMTAGLATLSGQASLGNIALDGGRLTGLAGSTINASTITVAQRAIFGSAGTVNGNLAVAGTLSPGASPGTMIVNGNVVLAGTSVSVFEITPTVSDKLVVNGQISIAQGATLQIVADTAVTPGKSLELITASGGITGSFTNVVKPASLFGFLSQDTDSITLMGQFLNDARYSAPVRGAIDYVNAVLVSGDATDALLAEVPRLVTVSGASDAAAFALLTPEAYAAADQIVVEQGLELAATGRSDAFASHRETRGAFTFASALGNTRTLDSGANGTARTRTTGYGFLGGLGLGSADWSLGGFVGYLDSRQTLFARAVRTDLDGIVAGVHARWMDGRLGIKATLSYSGGEAVTRRAVPGNRTARSRYDLTGWTADASVDYAVPLSGNWTVRPGFGVTAIRVTRDGVTESGSAYALTVTRGRDHAAFVDGTLTFKGGVREGARLRPHLSLGVRYQVDGRTPYALAALGGGRLGLEAASVSRAPVLATASLGADFAVSSKLILFGALNGEAGDADNRTGASAGLRLSF